VAFDLQYLYPKGFNQMPVYVYEILQADGTAGKQFEVHQSISEPALIHDPETGQPVRRVLCPPFICSRHTAGATRSKLDNKRLEKAGFTKYEKDRLTGTYHRVAGSNGPASFSKPPE
jgi:predicted nucleic acid-binding Zn ribbon protein